MGDWRFMVGGNFKLASNSHRHTRIPKGCKAKNSLIFFSFFFFSREISTELALLGYSTTYLQFCHVMRYCFRSSVLSADPMLHLATSIVSTMQSR